MGGQETTAFVDGLLVCVVCIDILVFTKGEKKKNNINCTSFLFVDILQSLCRGIIPSENLLVFGN